MSVLEVKELGVNFGGLRAVDNFNLIIEKNELVGLIGPNGAGKTTIFNLLTKVYSPTEGKMYLDETEINNYKTYQLANIGIARTFQNIRLFKECSVIDNVKVAMRKKDYSLFDLMFRTKKFKKIEKEIEERALELLHVFGLENDRDKKAKNLPYGKQRELEIARALALEPKLLLLDEPAAGMNPQETLDLMKTIVKIRDEFKIAILLIEHDMKLVKGICEKVTVLNYGSVLAVGDAETVLNDKRVIKAYLGD